MEEGITRDPIFLALLEVLGELGAVGECRIIGRLLPQQGEGGAAAVAAVVPRE